MKASAFSYARATSVGQALELLAAHGDSAKVLSGGQSLMPAMNLRLLAPELLVDIGDLTELKGIAVDGAVLRIGALTRHVDVMHSPDIATHAPLLTEAIAHVAHPAIRNKGTLGGSLAHADPASELPACMLALDATIIVRGEAGERRIAANDFFTGIYETALSAQELLVAVELPIAQKNATHFFHEFARRHGDYAIVGMAAQAVVRENLFKDLRIAKLDEKECTLLVPNKIYQFWIEDSERAAYMARGVFGQFIYIDPAAEFAAVKLSSWPEFLSVERSRATLAAMHAIRDAISI